MNITDHLRTLFLVYIRTNQQNAAQDVLNKNVKHFPAKEFQLLNAGCNIARSNFDKALESLMVAAAIQKKERSKLKGLPSASGLFQDGSKSVEAVGAMSGDKKSSGKASELSTNTGTNISTATLKSCDANVRAFQDRVSEMQQHVAQYEAEMTNDLHDSMVSCVVGSVGFMVCYCFCPRFVLTPCVFYCLVIDTFQHCCLARIPTQYSR